MKCYHIQRRLSGANKMGVGPHRSVLAAHILASPHTQITLSYARSNDFPAIIATQLIKFLPKESTIELRPVGVSKIPEGKHKVGISFSNAYSDYFLPAMYLRVLGTIALNSVYETFEDQPVSSNASLHIGIERVDLIMIDLLESKQKFHSNIEMGELETSMRLIEVSRT